MEKVECTTQNYLIDNCNDPMIDLSHEFNSMVTISYWGKKLIPPHRDQRFDRSGNFLHAQNCQKQFSPTVILAVGDPRCLKFQLMRHSLPSDNVSRLVKVKGATKSFDFVHGTLFVLHPSDEETFVRTWSGENNPTFWQHSSSGLLKGNKGMTLGLVLRSSTHDREVYKDTGMLVLNEDETSFDKRKHTENIHDLEMYLANELKMKEDHMNYKSLYEGMKRKFFSK